MSESQAAKTQLRVGLFVTCLVDLFRPSVGFAAVKLLEDAGCKVVVPTQTCCGQPAFNSGDRADAQAIARRTIDAFAGCDYVVAPSGSCAGMLAKHYPELFADEPDMAIKAVAFSAKCCELTSFLVDKLGVTSVAARFSGVAAYHDSCSGLRELGVHDQPRKLLASVEGLQPGRARRGRRLLRLRRNLRGQVRRTVRRDRRAQERQDRRDRRRHLARRRSRLPDEHGGQAAARRASR